MEGTITVDAAMTTMPDELHFWEREAVAFEVMDTTDSDTARGDYSGGFPGVIKPLLQWTNRRIE